MNRSLTTIRTASLLGLAVLSLAVLAEPAHAGLFNRRTEVIVVPSTSYVVADPYVVSSSYVAVPTRAVVQVPTSRVYAAPTVERVVVPRTRVVTVPTEEVYVVPTRRAYVVPEVVVPTVRSRVLVPSTRVYEVYP